MSSKHLSNRDSSWVSEARIVGNNGESSLEQYLTSFLPSHYCIISKPKDLKNIYGQHGIIPDLAIINTTNNKRIYIEKKTGNNGGNAHERAYKYLSPSLKAKVKHFYNVPDEPFVFVFSGDTFKKKKYVEEISLVLGHIPDNYLILDGSSGQIEKYCYIMKDMLET